MKITISILLLAIFGACLAQIDNVELSGATGLYGEQDNLHAFCHDEANGIYQYKYPVGFGYGNLTRTGNNSWTGRGTWVECGFIGGEIITIDSNGISLNWWFNEEGDAEKFLQQNATGTSGAPSSSQQTVFRNTRKQVPFVLEKSANTTTPTLEQCWWTNQVVLVGGGTNSNNTGSGTSGSAATLEGEWRGSEYDQRFCIIGNVFSRSSYNGTGQVGIDAGTVKDNIIFTGHFIEFQDFQTCLQGCDIFKVGGDGSFLYEIWTCSAYADQPPAEIFNERLQKLPPLQESGDVPLCLFAPAPAFGYIVQELSNATFPE